VTGNRRDAVPGAGAGACWPRSLREWVGGPAGRRWEYLHVAVDDASRLADTEVMASERKEDAPRGDANLSLDVFEALGGQFIEEPVSKQSSEVRPRPAWGCGASVPLAACRSPPA
jgi:hypothetical protein